MMDKSFEYNPKIDVIDNICSNINSIIYEIIENSDLYPLVTYESDGDYKCIKFMNFVIWSEECDDREYDDEKDQYKEDLESFIKRHISNTIMELSNINFE